ncbi:cellulose binding domain-containing protein [Nonomuraea salmonea]|uniref:cellulose binding domain-containing protein n=1 Tax=Nonomuraea salmonea TaxID=46181 RepID=UPI0031E75380
MPSRAGRSPGPGRAASRSPTCGAAPPTQSGTSVTVTNAGYNGNVGPGATTSFGFNATGESTQPTLTCTSS